MEVFSKQSCNQGSAHTSFLSLCPHPSWLSCSRCSKIPAIWGNRATGAYTFHTLELLLKKEQRADVPSSSAGRLFSTKDADWVGRPLLNDQLIYLQEAVMKGILSKKQRLLIFFQTESNPMVGGGGKREVVHFPKKDLERAHSRNRGFTQNGLFPKLAQPGESVARLVSGSDYHPKEKEKATDSFLAAAGTHRILWPSTFPPALS